MIINYYEEEVQEEQQNIFEELIKLKCDVNFPSSDAQKITPVILAALKGHLFFLEELKKHGADFNKKDAFGRCPYFCSRTGRTFGNCQIFSINRKLLTYSTLLLNQQDWEKVLNLNERSDEKARFLQTISEYENQEAISLSFIQIAYIMGHKEVYNYLNPPTLTKSQEVPEETPSKDSIQNSGYLSEGD